MKVFSIVILYLNILLQSPVTATETKETVYDATNSSSKNFQIHEQLQNISFVLTSQNEVIKSLKERDDALQNRLELVEKAVEEMPEMEARIEVLEDAIVMQEEINSTDRAASSDLRKYSQEFSNMQSKLDQIPREMERLWMQLKVFESCGGNILSDYGTIRFPEKQRMTRNRTRCVWIITLEKRSGFEISFNYLDGALWSSSQNCTKTGVKVYPLYSADSDFGQNFAYCGPGYDMTNVTVHGPVIAVVYYSQYNSKDASFSLSWRGLNSDERNLTKTYFHTREDSFFTRYPTSEIKLDRVYASWILEPTKSTDLTLVIGELELPVCPGNNSCDCNIFAVYHLEDIPNQGTVLSRRLKLCDSSRSDLLQHLQSPTILALTMNNELANKGHLDFGYFSRPMDSPEPNQIVTECGRPIDISSRGSIQYKLKGFLSVNETCGWIVRVGNSGGIQFRVIYSGLKSGSFIRFTGFKRVDANGRGFASMWTPGSDPIVNVDASVVLIQLVEMSGNLQQRGIILDFVGYQQGGATSSMRSDFVLSRLHGKLSYPEVGNYPSNAISVFLLSFPGHIRKRLEVTINLSPKYLTRTLEECADNVMIFDAENLKQLARICENDFRSPISITAQGEVVMVFSSDTSVEAGGFNFAWYWNKVDENLDLVPEE